MFEDLYEASHIVAGMGIGLDEALEIVKAAHAKPDEPAANVIYGVDFAARRRIDHDQLA